MARPAPALLVPLFLFPLMAGCLASTSPPTEAHTVVGLYAAGPDLAPSGEPEPTEPEWFQFAPIPQHVEAVYELRYGGEEVGEVRIDGWQKHRLLGTDGVSLNQDALILTSEIPGHRAWRILLGHDSSGNLAGQRMECTPVADAAHMHMKCPRNDPVDYAVEVPGSAGLPGLLGLGQMAGHRIQFQDGMGWADMTDSNSLALIWQAKPIAAPGGENCIELSRSERQPERVASLFAPSRGVMVACDSSPLPMRVQVGAYSLDLLEATWEGEFIPDGLRPATVLAPAEQKASFCKARLPADGPDLLPSDAYMEWARREDPRTGAWLADHPDGVALPSVGYRFFEAPPLTIGHSYTILGQLLLFDPKSGDLQPLGMEKSWERVGPLPPAGSYREASHVAQSLTLPGSPSLGCPVGLDLEESLAPLHTLVGDRGRPWFGFVAPEVGAPWQGAAAWLIPLAGAEQPGIVGPDAMRAFAPGLWPASGYVGYVPDDGDGELSVGYLVYGNVDLSGGIRWIEQDGWAPGR